MCPRGTGAWRRTDAADLTLTGQARRAKESSPRREPWEWHERVESPGTGRKAFAAAEILRPVPRQSEMQEAHGPDFMTNDKFPDGWDDARVQRVLAHYERQSEDDAAAEDEAGVASSETMMTELLKSWNLG